MLTSFQDSDEVQVDSTVTDEDDVYSDEEYRAAFNIAGKNGPTPCQLGAVLPSGEVAKKMQTVFQTSLELHATGQYMQVRNGNKLKIISVDQNNNVFCLIQPCQAIKTKLYPHQMYALAWMANRENEKDVGVPGGILADDMGLGKTLTVLSLVMSNFHDKKPVLEHKLIGTLFLEVLHFIFSSSRGLFMGSNATTTSTFSSICPANPWQV